ncbi:MAG: response regulator [Chloracidobacterium sp. CP2_5A]|nr:MAG: response regulator [Chloracidobacterium sp. CP2_5A]
MGLFDHIQSAREQVSSIQDATTLAAAIEQCERILQTDPTHGPTLRELGRLYQEQGQSQKACDAFCRAGDAAMERSDWEQALGDYRKAERLASGELRLDLCQKLFNLSYKLRRYEEAFERAKQIVDTLVERGNVKRAKNFLSTLPDLGAKDAEYRQLLESIAGLAPRQATSGGAAGTWQRSLARARSADEYFPGHTILIVDDEPELLNILEAALRTLGARIVTATNGYAACEKIKKHAPSLIISDLAMPGMDGSQLFEWVKSQPEHARAPFVCLSSIGSEAERVAAFEIGVEDYWTKPFHPTEIRYRVKHLLRRLSRPVDFQGKLSQVNLAEIVQILESGRRTGLLTIESGSEQAYLYLRDGAIINAECGALSGEQAVFHLVGWTSGDFAFCTMPMARERVIRLTPQQLLMEAFRRFDEVERLVSGLLPHLHEVFVCRPDFVKAPEVAEQLAQGGEFTASLETIRQLFDGSRTLENCCQALRHDLETLLLARALMDYGLLVPRAA